MGERESLGLLIGMVALAFFHYLLHSYFFFVSLLGVVCFLAHLIHTVIHKSPKYAGRAVTYIMFFLLGILPILATCYVRISNNS